MSDGRPLAQAGGQHNIPSFVVRLDCGDSSLKSPFGGSRPGRVKREHLLKGQPGGVANDDEEY